jgi:chloramphenicol 3-O-phosphotransferase
MISTYGHLILLNGTSSSGKSTILNEFKKLHPDYVAFKVDDWFTTTTVQMATERGWHSDMQVHPWQYLRDYVNKETARSNFDIEVREHLFTGIRSYYYIMQDVLRQGKNVILDTVLEYDREYINFDACFQEFNCTKVLVYCPVDVVLERIKIRNSSGIPDEQRCAFQLFEPFSAIYKLQEDEDEPIVDMFSRDSLRQTLHIAIQQLVAAGISESYVQRLREFERAFIATFKLDTQTQVKLVARHPYDLIINSSHASPAVLALQIKKFIHQES